MKGGLDTVDNLRSGASAPARIEHDHAVEAITRGVLRALDARDAQDVARDPHPTPWRTARGIAGGILDLQASRCLPKI